MKTNEITKFQVDSIKLYATRGKVSKVNFTDRSKVTAAICENNKRKKRRLFSNAPIKVKERERESAKIATSESAD